MSVFYVRQNAAYEVRSRDWSADGCSSALNVIVGRLIPAGTGAAMSRLRVTANSRDAALRAAQRARQPALTERVDDVVTAEELVSRDEPGELAYGQDPLAAVAGAGENEGEE